MYQLSNGSYVNANKITHFIEINNAINPEKKYLIILADGTKQYVNQEDFEALKEASGTVTYSDVIVTDKLSVGDIEDIEAEINKLKDYSDVKDVVGTYADLMAYDTSTLNLNDVIEVLSDENEDNANTMYKWDGTQFNIIGRLGPFYTKVESDAKYPTSIQYDSTNKKITQTKNNLTTDVVTASTLKTDMELNNVVNTGDSDTPVSGGTTKFTTGGAYIELNKKVDKEPGKGLSTNDYVTVDKEYLDNLRTTLPNVNDTTIALTYSQIKALKDANQLIAGRTYRITDYSTITIDSESRSAGNDFDIILKANTTNSFEPICSAHVRTGTNYFTQSYVSQWILWYNFDNDTNLCSWVDNTCKGYIYRMIDEYNNDLPYDFKNIQFKRYKIASVTYTTNYANLVGMYLGNTSPYGYTIDSNDFVWRYTFVCSDALDEDLSNKHIEDNSYSNCRYVKQIKIGARLQDTPYRGRLQLNNNVFISGNIICDMTFGNQTHTNTVQVVNDFSYNYFGSMMRRNLIYVTDFNHNNIRECLEDNLIGSGTKMFSWNWLGDHCSINIIQGMTQVYCLGYLRGVRADSSNETLSDVKLSTTFVGTENYSILITNAINDNIADISYSEFGTVQSLKLDHSKLSIATINYLGEVSITGRPVRVITSDIITNTDIYFDEDTSAVYEWEFKNSRGSSSNPLIIDFRDSTGALVSNAVKTYEKKIYSINETLTGWSGTFSYKVYDSTNKFEKTYMWSSVMDGLTPTANVILKDLTKHEVVDRVDSNYEIVDNILVNAIDKIDPNKNYTVTNHTDEATYRFTAPANAKLLMLQSIAGNSVKYSPSVASDNNATHIKTLPSTVYDLDVSKVDGVGYKVNQLVGSYMNRTVAGLTFTDNNNGTITVSGTCNATDDYTFLTLLSPTFVIGQKYIVSCSKNSVNLHYTINNSAYNFNGGSLFTYSTGGLLLSFRAVSGTTYNDTFSINVFNLTADFGSGNEPNTVSDCATAYLQRGINIYEYTPQQSSIKNNAFTGVTIKDSNDNITETISVDLTTIKDSNNVSLFPSGKLMGNSSVADFITPYNQESRWFEKTFTGEETWTKLTSEGHDYYQITLSPAPKTNDSNWVAFDNLITNIQASNVARNSLWSANAETTAYICIAYGAFCISNYLYQNRATMLTGKTIQYERKTYLTSNTDLTSLTKINAQSNGTITLNNTDNVDMPNLISYNGVIKHALATAVKQDGFNVWDEVWELGTIGEGGVLVPSTTEIRSKNYINVLPNTIYYLNTPDVMIIHFWDSNFNYIQNNYIDRARVYTTPSNARYMKFRMRGTYGITYKNDICISISNQDLNGTYKPYKAPITRLLPNSEAKYSWGITDGVRNTRVFCDDECNPVNEGQVNAGNQDLGGLNYTYEDSTYHIFSTPIPSNMKAVQLNKLCANYTITSNTNWDRTDKTLSLNGSLIKIIIKDMNFSNATIFKTSNNGVPLFYEKNATDTETLDDFDFSFDCEEGDTFTIIGCELLQCYATYSFLIESEDN